MNYLWPTLLAVALLGFPAFGRRTIARRDAERLEELRELNDVLAEMGEPRTCLEEIERWKAWRIEQMRRDAA